MIIFIFIFILGLIVGSFLNVVIYRLKNGRRIIWDRSRCPFCKKELETLDLIPVLSFLFFKGRCHYCKKKISWQYPLVELGTATLFAFTFLNVDILENNFPGFSAFGHLFLLLFFLFIISSLVVIFVYDLKYYLIPDAVLFPAIFITSVAILAVFIKQGDFSLIENILGAFLFSGIFLFQYFVSRGQWVGGGDVKLGLLLGLVLGWKLTLVCLFWAYVIGAFISLVLIALGKKTRKDILPFGPFLISSFIFCLFYGPSILIWYLNFLVL